MVEKEVTLGAMGLDGHQDKIQEFLGYFEMFTCVPLVNAFFRLVFGLNWIFQRKKPSYASHTWKSSFFSDQENLFYKKPFTPNS